MQKTIQQEMAYSHSNQIHLGKYLYLRVELVNHTKVCLSVAYKIDYYLKKNEAFETMNCNVVFTHVNKVKTGEPVECEKFYLN